MKITPWSLTAELSAVALVVAGVSIALQFGDRTSSAQMPAGQPSSSVTTTAPPGLFADATWLWEPIAADPALDPNSATWVRYFAAPGAQHVAELHAEGTTLIPATAVSGATPRYDITFTKPWGKDPFGSRTVPIPLATVAPHLGGDAHMAVADPQSGQVFALWQAQFDPATNNWTASWGGVTPINGDGIEVAGSSTAAGISRYAGVVTAEEMRAAMAVNSGLRHALVFGTDISGPTFVPPAIKSDGTNDAKVATPIPQGYRVQLDPSIDVDAIRGITPGERVVAKTLQTHGAYVIDKAGARMAFPFEAVPDSTEDDPGAAWLDAGFGWDYFDMAHIPWSKLRVLAPDR